MASAARRCSTCGFAIAALATAVSAGSADHAGAQDGSALVLLLRSEADADAGLSGALLNTLRIQLTGIAEVRAGPALPEAGLTRNLELASDVLERADATLAVWLERAVPSEDSESTVVLYVVGRQRDLALVRVARVVGRPGPELERSLALTIAGLLDSVLALRERGSTPDGTITRAFSRAPQPERTEAGRDRGEPTVPERIPEQRESSRWRAALELGGGGLLGTGTILATGAGRAGAALRFDSADAILEIGAALQVLSRTGAEESGSHVELDEVTVSVGSQLLAPVAARLSAGGYLHLGARYVEARGRASDGRSGSATGLLPAVWAGVEGRWEPLRGLELRLAVGVETTAIAQRYAVAGRPLLDLGVVRPTGSLSLVLAAP